MQHPIVNIAHGFISIQWYFHAFCIWAVLTVRWYKLKGVLQLMPVALLLLITAVGNAVMVEMLTTPIPNAPPGTMPVDTFYGLKTIGFISALVYGAVAANLITAAITYDPTQKS
jgi:hypothetical protein